MHDACMICARVQLEYHGGDKHQSKGLGALKQRSCWASVTTLPNYESSSRVNNSASPTWCVMSRNFWSTSDQRLLERRNNINEPDTIYLTAKL